MHGADVVAMPVSPPIKASPDRPGGRFICSACSLPLFTSADKIAAGSLDGRSSSPLFSGSISGSVMRTPDYVGGCVNTACTGCGASLGNITKRCSRHRPDRGHSSLMSPPSAALTRGIPCDQARGRRRRHLVLPRVRLAAEICAGPPTYNQAAVTSIGRSSCCQLPLSHFQRCAKLWPQLSYTLVFGAARSRGAEAAFRQLSFQMCYGAVAPADLSPDRSVPSAGCRASECNTRSHRPTIRIGDRRDRARATLSPPFHACCGSS